MTPPGRKAPKVPPCSSWLARTLQMLLQAVAGEIEELRCGLEIDFRADDVLVAKICRQPWELSVNIHPVFGPGREAMDSESMALIPSSELAP